MKKSALLFALTFAFASVSLTAQAKETAKQQPSDKLAEGSNLAEGGKKVKKDSKEYRKTRKLLLTPLAKMGLSELTLDSLNKSKMTILGHLVVRTKSDLQELGFENKSVSELEELVADKGLSFGMDVSKYALDED